MMSPNDYASAFDANINIQASVHPEIPDVQVNVNVSDAGKDGYTPVKGVDYWTEEDRQAIHDYVDERVAETGGGIGEETDPTVPSWLKEVNTLDEMKNLVREIPLPDSVDVPFGKVLTVGFVDDEDGIGWVLEYPSGGGDFDDSNLQPIYDLLGSEYSTKSEIETYVAGQIATSVTNEIENTASGDVISVNDSLDAPLRGLKLFGKTTQNGTPAPDNPVDLESAGDDGGIDVSVCGKNIYRPEKMVAGDPFYNSDGTTQVIAGVVVGYIPVKPNATYAITAYCDRNGRYVRVAQLTSGKEFVSGVRFAQAGAVDGGFRTFKTSGRTAYLQVASDPEITAVQIEHASDRTEYEQSVYQDFDISTPDGLPGVPVSTGGNYTDGSGQQWACDEIDLERGVYVQRVGRVALSGNEADGKGMGWHTNSLNAGAPGNIKRYVLEQFLPENIVSASGVVFPGFCSHFVPINANTGAAGATVGAAITKSGMLNIYSPILVLSEFIKWLQTQHSAGTPVTVYYILPEPVETELPDGYGGDYSALHTNKPVTTVINDSGAGMQISYAADTKAYIDNKFAQLAAVLAANV